jgi:hypothetical protein
VSWRHILPESSTSTHPQVVMSQLAYERDDPPFIFGLLPFLLLFIFHPAFYLLSDHCFCSSLSHRHQFQPLRLLSSPRHPSTTSWNIRLNSGPDPNRELCSNATVVSPSTYMSIASPLATFRMIWTLYSA